ncbi:MAG TPA: ATP-binding protein [Acidobacteriota bacterium]|jgi:PAS domain S-box-containing protein
MNLGAKTSGLDGGTDFAFPSFQLGRHMTRLSIRLKIIFAVAASAVLVYLAFLNLESRIRWHEVSDGVSWGNSRHGVVARLVETGGSAQEAGLLAGDVLLSINGRPVHDLDDYYRWVDRIRPGSDAVYLVGKAGTAIKVSYVVPLRLKGILSTTDFYLVVVAFIYLVTGIVIFLRNWRGQFSFHFFLVCLLSFILYVFRHTGQADSFDVFVTLLSSGALLILPAVFFHFCLNFPVRDGRLPREALLIAAYGSGLSLMVAHALWFAGKFNVIGVPRNLYFSHLFDKLHLTYFTLWFLAAAAVLVYSRLRCDSIEQRQQMKWIVGATVLAIVPFALFYALPFSLGFVPTLLEEMSILSLGLMPLGFGYAIIKYKLMDVDVIFKRGAAYFIASTALLAVYFTVVLFAGKLVLIYAPDANFVLFAVAALVTAFLFGPLRGHIQGAIDRFFYKEQYDYRTSFSDFSKTLSSEISLDRLAALLMERLQKTINVDQVSLLMAQEGDWYYMRYAVGVPDGNRMFRIPEEVFREYDRALNPLYFSARQEHVRTLRNSLHEIGLNYIQPLRAHDRVIAVLALGRRRDGDWLSSEDFDLLEAISGYAAIAIENASLYQSVASKANELEQLKIFSESIIESIQVGVVTVDPEGRITSLNSAAESLLGSRRHQLAGKMLDAVFPSSLLDQVRASSGGSWLMPEALNFYRVTVHTAAGQTRMVNLHFVPFVSRDDVVSGTLLVIDDVTQKVRLEDQLVQAEKLTSLGVLAAGVAHEVNTPLAGISSYTQMLLKELPAGHPYYPILKKMETQTFRASDILNNLLNFARLSGTDFRELNLNHLVMETVSLLDHQLKKQNIQVSMELDPTLPGTYGNSGKLQQVFMNLLLNAKDAMPQGGQIQLRTERLEGSIQVVIKDNGVGIEKEHIKRIYDPFFTTKDVGRGTGLGLSISYGIIQEHSGNIRVESEPGKGTEFTLQFPVRRIH